MPEFTPLSGSRHPSPSCSTARLSNPNNTPILSKRAHANTVFYRLCEAHALPKTSIFVPKNRVSHQLTKRTNDHRQTDWSLQRPVAEPDPPSTARSAPPEHAHTSQQN